MRSPEKGKLTTWSSRWGSKVEPDDWTEKNWCLREVLVSGRLNVMNVAILSRNPIILPP